MSTKLRFGVLSSQHRPEKVIAAMQQGELTTVAANASRDLAQAQDAATKLGIPTAYGSYEELLADPNIGANGNPARQLCFMFRGPRRPRKPESTFSWRPPPSMTVAEAKTLGWRCARNSASV